MLYKKTAARKKNVGNFYFITFVFGVGECTIYRADNSFNRWYLSSTSFYFLKSFFLFRFKLDIFNLLSIFMFFCAGAHTWCINTSCGFRIPVSVRVFKGPFMSELAVVRGWISGRIRHFWQVRPITKRKQKQVNYLKTSFRVEKRDDFGTNFKFGCVFYLTAKTSIMLITSMFKKCSKYFFFAQVQQI